MQWTTIPGTRQDRLYDLNVRSGGNQIQLRRTFLECDVSAVRDSVEAERSR